MLSQKIVDIIYSVVTGNRHRRSVISSLGAVFFFALVLLFIFCSFQLDQMIGLPAFLPGTLNSYISTPLIVIGLLMIIWPMLFFFRLKGTPVPFNPPPKLITNGPYAFSRNPMVTGIFILLFGLGCRWNSFSLVFIFTPLFIILNAVEIKMIEEPEIEKRFGREYVEYKMNTPMFFPRFFRRG